MILWILLIALIFAGFLWFKTHNLETADTRSILPESTAIFFEFASFPEFVADLQNNKMWKELSSSGFFGESVLSLNRLDSLIKNDSQLHDWLSKRICISVSIKANKSPGILFCIPESVRSQEKVLLKFLSKKLTDFNNSKRHYEGSTIYDLTWRDFSGTRNFSFTVVKGVLIGSFFSELVEDAVNQKKNDNNFTSRPEFTSIMKTIGNKVHVNVFVNYKNASGILNNFLKPSCSKSVSDNCKLASWAAFDAEIFPQKLILNGFSNLDDSLDQEMKIFRNQEPIEFSCPGFLPDAIDFFKVYGFSDKEQFFHMLKDYIKKDPESKELLKRKYELLANYGIDLDTGIAEMIADEYGKTEMNVGGTSYPLFFIELKSQSLAEQQFMDWLSIWAQKNGLEAGEFITDYRIDGNCTLKVYKFPVGGIPSMVFGNKFESTGIDYFTFLNNYLVFANSYNSLKEFIYQVVLGNTLHASGSSYSALEEELLSRSNFYLFAKPASVADNGEAIFSDPVREIISNNKRTIAKFSAISIQFSAAEELLYSRIFIGYSGVLSGRVKTVWASRLDTLATFKPAIVLNHASGEKEILIQDLKNQVYLLSNSGIILWKLMIDGPIISEIYQVDFYNNGKKQYLFNTRRKIYLLDRNGNPVEKYPVELRSAATAGISVFDYDQDRTIRICVPCDDRRIYMYDKDGKIIPGWQPERTDNEVQHPVQHFRIGSRDYIVAIDKYKFYILDRKGKKRTDSRQYFQVSSCNGFYIDTSRGGEQAGMVTTDTSGSIMRVYFSGKVEKILEQNLPPVHYFVFADLDGDRKGEFLTASGRTLQVMDPSLKERFKINFKDSISYRPVVYEFSANNNKIGIVLSNPGNIYLYNNNGILYNGFPLEGAAPFSISSFPGLGSRFNMIVGTKKNFLYNYSVQ